MDSIQAAYNGLSENQKRWIKGIAVALLVVVSAILIIIFVAGDKEEEVTPPVETAQETQEAVRGLYTDAADALEAGAAATEGGAGDPKLQLIRDFKESLQERKPELASNLSAGFKIIIEEHPSTTDSFYVVASGTQTELDGIAQNISGFTAEYYDSDSPLNLADSSKSGFNRCESERDNVSVDVTNLVMSDYYDSEGLPLSRDDITAPDDPNFEAMYECYNKSTCGYVTDPASLGAHTCTGEGTISSNPGLIECPEGGCTDAVCCSLYSELFSCTQQEEEGDDADACATRICTNDFYFTGNELISCIPEVQEIQSSLQDLFTIELDAIILEIMYYLNNLESKGLTEDDIINEIDFSDRQIDTYFDLLNIQGMSYTEFKDYLNVLLNTVKEINHRTWPVYSDYITNVTDDEQESIDCYDNKDNMNTCLKGFFPKSEEIEGTTYTISEEDWNTECERQFQTDDQVNNNEVIDKLISSDTPRIYQLDRLLKRSNNTGVLLDDICSGSMCDDSQNCKTGNSPQRTVATRFGNMMDNFKQYSLGDLDAGASLMEDDQTFGMYTAYFDQSLSNP